MEEVFANQISDKAFVCFIYKEFLQSNNEKTSQLKIGKALK